MKIDHWKINDWDEEWGHTETYIVKEYVEYLLNTNPDYLLKTNPDYLKNREQMIDDVSVLIWSIFYDSNKGRAATRNEIDYGIAYSMLDEEEQQRIIKLWYNNMPLPPVKSTLNPVGKNTLATVWVNISITSKKRIQNVSKIRTGS